MGISRVFMSGPEGSWDRPSAFTADPDVGAEQPVIEPIRTSPEPVLKVPHQPKITTRKGEPVIPALIGPEPAPDRKGKAVMARLECEALASVIEGALNGNRTAVLGRFAGAEPTGIIATALESDAGLLGQAQGIDFTRSPSELERNPDWVSVQNGIRARVIELFPENTPR